MPAAELDPGQALVHGGWVKLICGASNQDLLAVEDLAGIYALAGVHCIDVAADAAVVAAARRGIAWARSQAAAPSTWVDPWLMLSLSDGADPHFRKAWFDPRRCPPSCARPCERVCPALAIGSADGGVDGVVAERCYGCGRCLPACPHGLIEERGQVLAAEAVAPLLARLRPDAVEIHTQLGRGGAFAARLRQLQEAAIPLQRLAVSCGLEGASDGTPATPAALAGALWGRHQALRAAGFRPLWQLDGRPMSGDVGEGTAHAAIRLLAASASALPPGPLQLAGGTNGRTWPLLQARAGLGRQVAGVAFGGVARRQLQPLLQEAERQGQRLLDLPPLRQQALALARGLLQPWLRRLDRHAG
ncbi:MAG: LdpA C-terminal domain-containing domain [Prochlorococcaceae cyanobacterium]